MPMSPRRHGRPAPARHRDPVSDLTAPGTFERVYATLKRWLRTREFGAGDRLEPAHLSDRLNASVTPVRDALHRLTGERLVEAPRHEGFRVPLASELMLRHLYAWHRDLLLFALARRGRRLDRSIDTAAPTGAEPLARQQALFEAIAAQSGNSEHLETVRALLERLEPYQHLEESLLDALEEETAAIGRAVESGDRGALRRLLVTYHRRRARIVPDLVALASRK